jgi:LPXTG-site transpeptidase (sortase) family protein
LWLERALVIVGIAGLGYYSYRTVEARTFQREQVAAFAGVLQTRTIPNADAVESSRAPGNDASTSADRSDTSRNGVIALLEIPRLELSSAVVSGDGDDVLDVAIGHLPDTPQPWETGNSAFAAHRDGLFRSLRRIRVGDRLRVRTKHGDFAYEVRQTRIVDPTDLSVLAPTRQRTLTLITCYPFNFVGRAPRRFVVHAAEISLPSSAQ